MKTKSKNCSPAKLRKPQAIWDTGDIKNHTFVDPKSGARMQLKHMSVMQLRRMLTATENERVYLLEKHIEVFNIVDRFSSWQ